MSTRSTGSGSKAKPPPPPDTYDAKLKKAGSAESTLAKAAKRSVVGLALLALFVGVIRLGPIMMCVAVFIAQVLLFRELANVRYKAEKSKQVPFFRTVQWVWFLVAIFYAYGNSITEYFKPMGVEQRYVSWVSFSLYWSTFVVTVLSLKKGSYKYQLGQLTWTVVCLVLVVGQLMFVVHNILVGMFWFVFPMSLVIFNDISAYFCGLFFGRKVFKVPFLPLSPNKTWEGFVGAAILTVIFGFLAPVFMTQFEDLTCPAQAPGEAHPCELSAIFRLTTYALPRWLAWLFSKPTVQLLPVQLHGIAFGVFASLVAPFGGFFASAIKRAYEIKDFDNIIPGHGGLMDRFDCQFLMQLCSSVHYKTFVESLALTVPFVLRQIDQLDPSQQAEVLEHLRARLQST
eukprot:GGOE01018261.1.p1 GENE.GGOE01018261.1~~GGOE01018261.1.p1  ORF type:complete len:400 (-),score=125.51 GGOE01018261.1:174-1373(-)